MPPRRAAFSVRDFDIAKSWTAKRATGDAEWERRQLADSVAKVVLHWGPKILGAAGAAFV